MNNTNKTTTPNAKEQEKRTEETDLKYQPCDPEAILRREGKDIRIGGISI